MNSTLYGYRLLDGKGIQKPLCLKLSGPNFIKESKASLLLCLLSPLFLIFRVFYLVCNFYVHDIQKESFENILLSSFYLMYKYLAYTETGGRQISNW